MPDSRGFLSVKHTRFYLVGIKGTGMAALAELLHKKGAIVTGSDVNEKFYTDEILMELGIHYYEGFSPNNIETIPDIAIHSAAYDPNVHVELLYVSQHGVPIFPYNRALCEIAKTSLFGGIAGVHGKTTTTAIAASILKNTSLPVSVLTGSAVSSLDNRSVLYQGDKYFIAETCEYRRHFLCFTPKWLVLTSIEPDHLDYFTDYDDIFGAFLEYGRNIQYEGSCIYCADDSGATELYKELSKNRPDIHFIPYGANAEGRFQITRVERHPGETQFYLSGFKEPFSLFIPGEHNVGNAAAAIALTEQLLFSENNVRTEIEKDIALGLKQFAGSKRRSETIGEAEGVRFIDDYGHHPTAIRKTLRGYREFYPGRRIILDFMSHTYSRTQALFEEFSNAFLDADMVVLHKIYASAREKSGEISGEDLFNAVAARMKKGTVVYFPEVLDAFDYVKSIVQTGDLFITMGAGNNWMLGRKLLEHFTKKGSDTL